MRVGQAFAVGLHRSSLEDGFVEQAVDGMVHGFVELVGKGFADQLVGDQIGHGGIQRNQHLAEVADVAVVDLLDQTMGEVGLIEQGIQALMAFEQC